MIVLIVVLISLGLFGLAVVLAVYGYHDKIQQQAELEQAAMSERWRLRQLEADATRQIQQLTHQAYDEMLLAVQRNSFPDQSYPAVER